MTRTVAELVLELFTTPLVELGFEIVGDPIGTSKFLADRIGETSEYQLRAAVNEIATTTDRTRGGRLLFPEPKRAIEAIRSNPLTDPRTRPPRPVEARRAEPPFVTVARKLVADCDADPVRRQGCDRTTPGRYDACAQIVAQADRGEFDKPFSGPTPSHERPEELRRVLSGVRIGGRAADIPDDL